MQIIIYLFAKNVVIQRDKWRYNEEVVKFGWSVQEGFIGKLILKKCLHCRCFQLSVEIGKERGM